MANQVAETGLKDLLAAASGDYVAVYKKLVADEDAQAVAKAPRSTVAYRQTVWKNAVAKLDRGILARINKTMKGYLQIVRKNAEITSAEAPKVLDAAEANGLMTEFLELRDIEEFVKARREDIRRTVFGHITEVAAAAGEEFPEHVNGSLEVAELGYRFSKEGTGRGDSDLDQTEFKNRVGEELFAQLTVTEVIPAQEVTKLSIEKVMEMATENPAILEAVRESLIAGDWKNPRLWLRKI